MLHVKVGGGGGVFAKVPPIQYTTNFVVVNVFISCVNQSFLAGMVYSSLQSDLVNSALVISVRCFENYIEVNAGTTHYLCLQCSVYALSMARAQGTNEVFLTRSDCILILSF